MKLLFVNDHIFLKFQNEYYTSGSLTFEVMQRYINVFGNINIISRGKDINNKPDNLLPSSINNTRFVRVPNHRKPTKILNYFRIKRIIKNEVKNADYIIARTSSLAFIAIKYAIKYRKPYLVEVVGCAWDSSWNYSLLGKIIAPFSYIQQKYFIKNAPYVIYVTNKFLQKRYPTNGENTNCSNVSLREFDNAVLNKRTHRIKMRSKNEKIIIGTTAAVNVRYKGQQYIIQALGKLKKKGICNFEYQLVGSGDQTYLHRLAKKYDVEDQVKFLGVLNHNSVFEWLDTIDMYAQPSKQEGLPRALIEAMSRGLLAIGARTAGIPELIEDKYIFNNNHKKITDICNILESITPDDLIIQSIRNFEESKNYAKVLIERKRNQFLNEFLRKGIN